VGKGTLYEYFKNKQDIFDEVCIEFVDLIIDDIKYISNMDNTFKEKLLILFNEKLKMESEFANMSIDNILSSKNIISEKTVKTIIGKISEMYSAICSIIDKGKKEGVVVKNIQSETLACLIVGTMSEYLRLKFHNKEYEIKEDDVIFNLLYNGFAVKQ
jgi:AcrR family transcriptional regulator